ncbi:MAG: cobyrinate a,c-diamide synthase [Desulfamplus sp.]|nr:cobyrinate a,c-diamide synthase [Desulfamplus sp.]
MKGFVIAGTGSGSGKTTITLGILAYLSKLGYKVAPFKVGPDFIDPGHHTALTGKISRNLDSWMLSKSVNEKIFAKGCLGANFDKESVAKADFNKTDFGRVSEIVDIAVVEGVMGLFDGYSGSSEAGSTAQMAKWLKLPVVLVVDAKSMARSAAAIVQGFENFDPEIEFAGVIFSKTGSQRHYDYLKEAIEGNCRMKCLGHIPRNPEITMPERHLGLVTSDEYKLSSDVIGKLVEIVDKNTSIREMVETLPQYNISKLSCLINLDSYQENSNENINSIQTSDNFQLIVSPQNIKTRIAVARDKAFCFYYQENIEALKRYGAEIVQFSPIDSPSLPPDIHGIYLGGGYPEIFAQQLSDNKSLIKEIKEKSLQGMPIYGECGGFMYLCKDITVLDEPATKEHGEKKIQATDINIESLTSIDKIRKKYPMAGCFPFSAVMSKKMRSLGYRQITLKQDTIIGKKGDILRGHEFHYSSLESDNINLCGEHNGCVSQLMKVYDTTARDGQELSLNGYQVNNTLGSYLHLHFESMEGGAALAFVDSCQKFCCLSES